MPNEGKGIALDGGRVWNFDINSQGQLQLRAANSPTLSYQIPAADIAEIFGGFTGFIPAWVRITPTSDRVEILFEGRYYRWKFNSRQLERDVVLQPSDRSFEKVTRDGEAAISASPDAIIVASTRPQRTFKRVLLAGLKTFDSNIAISPFGAYALYKKYVPNGSASYLIVETRSGRVLWTFSMDDINLTSISPDETRIAIPMVARRQWEIRELATGNLLCTLPAVAESSGAFSQDNSTFYSVANGVLYRQRAR